MKIMGFPKYICSFCANNMKLPSKQFKLKIGILEISYKKVKRLLNKLMN